MEQVQWNAYAAGHPGVPGHADSEWGAAIGNTFNDSSNSLLVLMKPASLPIRRQLTHT